MIVFIAISEGLPVSALAASIAASSARPSWPSQLWTCQPQALNRAGMSSEKLTEVGPSMVMLLSS